MSEQVKLRNRRILRSRDADRMLEEVSRIAGPIEAKKVEAADAEDGIVVYVLDGEVQLFRGEDAVYPTLRCPCISGFPSVVVDMGAVPFVCKGADVMAPGIKEIQGSFTEGALVVIRDVNHRKALSVGKALKGSAEIMESRKGKVIRNLHYVGDKIWNAKL